MPHDDDLDLDIDEVEFEDEIEDRPPVRLSPVPIAEVLPKDFELPALLRFVPNQTLKVALDEATRAAALVDPKGPEGLKAADEALATLRARQKAIMDSFEEPCRLANDLHKRLTSKRAEWTKESAAEVHALGLRIAREVTRIREEEEARKRAEQARADAMERERIAAEAAEAERLGLPAVVVEEKKRQAETATAPPIDFTPRAMETALTHTSVTKSFKARLVGTDPLAEQQPEVGYFTMKQLQSFYLLLQAILDKKAPATFVEMNWSVIDNRAKADKQIFSIPGLELYEHKGTRGKGRKK